MLGDSLPGGVGDYAANLGTTGFDYIPDDFVPAPNGVFRAANPVRFREITDGLSNTLFVGEKHVPRNSEGAWPWDCGIYDGHNPACNTRGAGPNFPLAVVADDTGWKFGSRHAAHVFFVFGDGSVRPLLKTIDPVTLGLLAQRNDGMVIPDY
jgi:hypothetical protein